MTHRKKRLSAEAKDALASLVRRFHSNRLVGSEDAATYHEWVKHYVPVGKNSQQEITFDQRLASVLQNYAGTAHLTAVDVGCGTGSTAATILYVLSPESLVLLDPDIEALELAKKNLANLKVEGRISSKAQLEYKVGYAEELSRLVKLQSADIVVMRRSLRYVAAERRPTAFSEIYATLKEEGQFVFDLPVKEPNDWLSEEDTPLSAVAAVLYDNYGIIGLEDAMKTDHNPPDTLWRVVEELRKAGFSRIRKGQANSIVNLDTATQLAYKGVDELVSLAIIDAPVVSEELEEEKANLKGSVHEYLRSLFGHKALTLGITLVEAQK